MTVEKSAPRQAIISCIILSVLCGIGGAILYVHSSTAKYSEFFVSIPQKAATSSQKQPLSVISQCIPDGFHAFGKQEAYDRDTLFEKINGKAPLYLDAEFYELRTQRVLNSKDSSLWFELYSYDMQNAQNAFSVYSRQRRSETETIASLASVEHYKTENGLYVWLGNFYLEFVGSDKSDLLEKAMSEMAAKLVANFSDQPNSITELTLFPEQNLLPNSFKLYLQNAFGSDALNKTYMARYRMDDQEATAFICVQKDSEQATRTIEKYLSFLHDSGAVELKPNLPNVKYFDLYGTTETVFRLGQYVAGVHEGDGDLISEQLTLQLLNAIQQSHDKKSE